MTVEEVRRAFRRDSLPAIFTAGWRSIGRDNGPRILVYPLKNGSGYLWLLMDGFDWNDLDSSIKDGGIYRDKSPEQAIKVAVDVLLGYERERRT